MTEIATEDDLWKLFSKKPKDHRIKGEGFILWEAISQVLNAKSFGDGKSFLEVHNEERFYLVASSQASAVVRQCDLRSVGHAFKSNAGHTFVGYLGTIHPTGEALAV
ncbi:hypothetical protein N6L24_14020 [Cognatishimia sp. SS12]|uniref:hypothetical protein n=1 Tax=Cognatishimia sp. SS12 TaxID=2979465 RepID=UPI00232F9F35|nr:hypothetical protein [Cognatishimia sp. SS12]MDC0739401.1 hypothetical protein [Cognatishimia sp. SS12]